jgi:omega-amidase
MTEIQQNSIKIAIVQFNVIWHDVKANLQKLNALLETLNTEVDLIILPEMFATGFTLLPEKLNIEEQFAVLNWMKEISVKFQTAIMGSYPYFENDKYYNRLFFITPDSLINFYDKRHLFSIGDENKKYTGGDKRKIMNWKGWKIMPLICYDLRFPAWSRNNLGYDLLVYCSNWPEIRIKAWDILLKARAIENQCYVAGANRIGVDGQNIRYSGNSQVISPLGENLGIIENEENILIIELLKNVHENLRNSFPVLKDMDTFEIN